MRYSSKAIPEAVLRLMPEAERRRLGKAGRTLPEIVATNTAKSERKLQGQIVNLLHLRGIEVGWGRTDRKSGYTVDWPDLTFALAGIPVAFEVKMPGEHPTMSQFEMHARMRLNGWLVFVVRSVDEAREILNTSGRVVRREATVPPC